MGSTTTDRRIGLNSGAAFKVPCKAGSTVNLVLSGEQTVDGVACVTGDRVLVKNQADQTTNGIWVVSTASWTRDLDFDGNLDAVTGTQVMTLNGNTNANSFWRLATTSAINFGSSLIAFARSFVNDSTLISFIQSGVGAVLRTVQDELRLHVNVVQFGAVSGGSTAVNDAAFSAARAITNRYHIPSGTYALSAAPDPFLDCFTSSSGVTLIVGGVSYDCSNAFAGPLRYVAASATKTNIVHAKSGNIVQYWQDGGPGTATGFYRGLAFTTDSHWVQAQPATNGGETDILWQRSTLNADPGGNRFNFTFEEALDRLFCSYATTASGFPSFDSAWIVYAGLTPSLQFPALRADFQQGYSIQTRALGALKYAVTPGATRHTVSDLTSANPLGYLTRSGQTLAGITFDTLLDAPIGVTQPRQWGGVFGDTGSTKDGALPITKNLWDTSGATRNQVIGTMRVAAQPSGAAGSYRETRILFDGTTVTLTDLVNTLPAQVTATVALVSTTLQFQASYAGGLGGGCTVSVMIEWCGAGR